jgi:hypothetical protein
MKWPNSWGSASTSCRAGRWATPLRLRKPWNACVNGAVVSTSWAKLDDGFWMHPKVVMAGNESAGIFCRCLSYCGAYLTDGLIPEPVAVSIAGTKAKLESVINAGLLERVALPDGTTTGAVYIRDYSDYNPLRDQVEAEKEARKVKAQTAAAARWSKNGSARR